MGYTTSFSGTFLLDRPLDPALNNYLKKFADTRRMKRDATKTATRPDPVREAAGLPVGDEGAYFVGESGFAGQDNGSDVLEHNYPPKGQPGLWCQWVPTADGTGITWDEGEKFYEYTAWLQYIIDNFLAPAGYELTGEVEWQGEDTDDRGIIGVKDNQVYVRHATVSFGEPEYL